MKRIYLDYAATTPTDPEVVRAMQPYFTEIFGNPSSIHYFGREAKKALEDFRLILAEFIGAKPEEVAEMETRLYGQDISLEPVGDDGEEGYGPLAYLTDAEAEPALQLEREQTQRNRSAGLEKALKGLDDRSRRIIEARWLREQDTATLHELAAELGVSAERVRQIEAKALQKMKLVISA